MTHEWAYAQAVTSAGAQDWHISWLIDDIGPPVAAASLRALVERSLSGFRPQQSTVT